MWPASNFERAEFACHCGCGYDTVDAELLEVLEWVRESFGVPVSITSGARCIKHNKSVGGAPSSQHLLGKAADIKVKGRTPEEVFETIDGAFPNKYGIGLYKEWVHIDVRSGRSRWKI